MFVDLMNKKAVNSRKDLAKTLTGYSTKRRLKMKKRSKRSNRFKLIGALTVLGLSSSVAVFAVPLPGGTMDPTSIPKYVTPLVIPPVMPTSVTSPAPAAQYDIAVRQFKQQILPGGMWGVSFPNPLGAGTVGPFPATTVWSYGRAADPLPDSTANGGAAGLAPAANSTFNYPAFTVEATSNTPLTVRWINDLVNPTTGLYLPHLFPVDQTLHWANPTGTGCTMPMTATGTDCHTNNPAPYAGPVPLVTHVHGAHVLPNSDGFPEAWWLPGAPGTKGIPAGYAERGSSFGQADATNTVAGSAYFSYPNSQPASTIWYHDHALGLTRENVVAGPAGFWLIRGGANDTAAGVLPGPAPVVGQDPNLTPAIRNTIREIPLVIQDRAFDWADAAGNTLPTSVGATQAKLFYPTSRTFFDGFTGPFISLTASTSDIAPIWNPEVFFNTIVVNGTTWPQLTVAPTRYRLRLLDGCTARTLNLSMFVVTAGVDGKFGTADDVKTATELPFYQIGGDQGFLPKVVKITKGFATQLPGGGVIPAATPAPSTEQGMFLMPAERADVLVDFTGLPNGTHVRVYNTAPDAPFQGFPANLATYIPSDPLTTGQVMEFIVDSVAVPLLPSDATTTAPQNLVLPAEGILGASTNTRKVSLNEMDSEQVCIEADPLTGAIIRTIFTTTPGDPNFATNCALASVTSGNISIPMGPRLALLGTLSANSLVAIPKMWFESPTELPLLNSTETWEIYNTTADAHPIHVHLVRFEVVNRQNLIPGTLVPDPTLGSTTPAQPTETGYKDTVVALPGQVTRIKALFNIPGKYVWHCHIVDHEDNEMMRPYRVVMPDKIAVFRNGQMYRDTNGNNLWDAATDSLTSFGMVGDKPVSGDWNSSGTSKVGVFRAGQWYLDMNGNSAWDAGVDVIKNFGIPGDIPVTGNWDGLGTTKIGVYRNGTWYLDLNGNGAFDPTIDAVYTFGGNAGDIPVVGDWTGTGIFRIGTFNNGVWKLDTNGNGIWEPGIDATYTFGVAGDVPVVGNWTGTGSSKIGVTRNGQWYLDTNGNGVWDAGIDALVNFGVAGDLPLIGQW
jgi:FtsP/CotA-like multicopper oxidase with cupredoxin domain